MPSARHLEERLKVSQSVSRQASSQSGSQLGKRAGGQARTNTWLSFFQWGGGGAQLQNKGNHVSGGTVGGRMAEDSNHGRQFKSWPLDAGARRPVATFFFLDLGSNPSKHKLLTPPQKNVIQFQGGRGLKIKKNPLGDCFVGQNNDITTNIMPWGMLLERPPKRGGVWRPRSRLI